VPYVYVVCEVRHKKDKEKVKRVQVTFTKEQWNVLERFRGIMGNDDAEIIRNIVLAWLAEKSFIASIVKGSFPAGDRHEE